MTGEELDAIFTFDDRPSESAVLHGAPSVYDLDGQAERRLTACREVMAQGLAVNGWPVAKDRLTLRCDNPNGSCVVARVYPTSRGLLFVPSQPFDGDRRRYRGRPLVDSANNFLLGATLLDAQTTSATTVLMVGCRHATQRGWGSTLTLARLREQALDPQASDTVILK